MLLNKEYLTGIAKSYRTDMAHSQMQIFNENCAIFSRQDEYDVFLSHSYLDKKLVYAIVEIFNEVGYSVYVDWMVDTQLDRSKINRETAQTLRDRMDICKCLTYVSTSNITLSKWCPWELGYVDGKSNSRCAILPVMETEKDTFKGQEYLGLYPYIDYERDREGKYEFWINDPLDKKCYIPLRRWLNGEDPYIHK